MFPSSDRRKSELMSDQPNGLTYAQAGVDIDAGNALVDAIKPLAKATRRPGAEASLGGFGALFDLKAAGYDDPLLVTTTDGVGTKLRIAIDTASGMGKFDTPTPAARRRAASGTTSSTIAPQPRCRRRRARRPASPPSTRR